MTLAEQIEKHPEWTVQTHVETWLTSMAREAGEYAENVLAEYGARLDGNEASVSGLTWQQVRGIYDFALMENA